MGRKTPPFGAYTEWTTAKFFGFIRSGLRDKFNRWPPKYEVLNEARITVTGQRHRYEYTCAACNNTFKQKEVQVDHITPAGSLKSFEDLPAFVEKLFCGKEGLQVMCKACHKEKTLKERAK